MNKFLNKCKIPRNPPLWVQDRFVTDCKVKSSLFNNYFVNVATNLKRENNPDFYRSYLCNPSSNSIYLRSVEESEVFDRNFVLPISDS